MPPNAKKGVARPPKASSTRSEAFDWQAAVDSVVASPRPSDHQRSISGTSSRSISSASSSSSSSGASAKIPSLPVLTPSPVGFEIAGYQPSCAHCGSPLPVISYIPVTPYFSNIMVSSTRRQASKRSAADAFDPHIPTPAPDPAPDPPPDRDHSVPPSTTSAMLQIHTDNDNNDAATATAGPSTSTRPSKKKRVSDKEQLAQLTRQLEETKARLKAAESDVTQYRKYKEKYYQEKADQSKKLIPRPEGERGKNGWNLRGALQLDDHNDLYLTILSSVREAITAAGLDWKKTFHRQETSRLTDCYRLIKEQNAYLKKFEGDWPARELVISCLQNKRKTRNRKRKRGVRQDAVMGSGGDDDDPRPRRGDAGDGDSDDSEEEEEED